MKILLSIVTGILFIVSCTTKLKENNAVPDNEKLVRQYFEHFNRHEWDKIAAMYTDTADFKDPSLGEGVVKQTRQQIADKYKQLHGFLPDIGDKIINLYPSGNNHIIVEFVSTGSSPDGVKINLPICTIFTIENGKITKDYTYFDNAAQ